MTQRYPVTGGTPITEEVAIVCIQRTQIVTYASERKASGCQVVKFGNKHCHYNVTLNCIILGSVKFNISMRQNK